MASDNAYLNTLDRIEPHVHPLDQDGSHASIAISLKRIADALEAIHDQMCAANAPSDDHSAS